jgi:osmotically-inducible protein OsmY
MLILSIGDKVRSATIVRAARRQLRSSPYFFLRDISCHVECDVLTLGGRVPLEPLKAFAESIVLRVEGVREVVNRIEVCDPQGAIAWQPVE